MGTVASNFPGDGGEILADSIKPTDDDWLPRHAKECKGKLIKIYMRTLDN